MSYGFGNTFSKILPKLEDFNPLNIDGLQLYLNKDLGVNTKLAADFNGTNQFLSSTSTDFDKGDESFSFGGWVNFDALGSIEPIIGKWNFSTNQASFLVRKETTNVITFYMSNNGTSLTTVSTVSTVNASTWYFVACVYDSVNDLMKLSINGGAFVTSANSVGAYASSTEDLLFGRQSATSPIYSNSKQDAPFFYNKALTLAEIQGLYNGGLGLPYNSLTDAQKVDLVSWWELNETSGTRLDEHSTNDLTDNNSVGYALGKIQEPSSLNTNEDKVAADFNGTNYLDGAANYLDFSTFDVLSIQFWVKRQVVTSAPTMLGVWNGASSNSWRLRMDTAANVSMDISTTGSNTITLATVSPITPFNTWNCVSMYINNTTKSFGVSLNGGAFFTSSFTGNIFSSGTPFTLGGLSNNGASNLFTGEMDSVNFWTRQLTVGEFTSLYNSGNGLSYSNFSAPLLVDYYDGWFLGERSGTRTSINGVDLADNNSVGYDIGKIVNPSQVETLVSQWIDQSPNMFVLSQDTVTKQPLLSSKSINTDGVNDVLSLAVSNVFGTHTSGILFFSFYYDGVGNQTFLSSSDSLDNTQIFSIGSIGGGLIAISATNTNQCRSTDSAIIGFNYGWVRSNGTSYSMSLNGVAQTVVVGVGSNNGDWFADIPGRDDLSVGAVLRPSVIYSKNQSCKVIYSNLDLTDSQIAKIDKFMSQP